MVPIEDMEAALQEYREAINVARDEDASDEAREAAKTAIPELRNKLDEMILEDKRQREDDVRAEAVETRKAYAAQVAQAAGIEPPKDPWEELREDVLAGKGVKRTVNVDLMEKRTQYDISTAASGAYGSYLVPQTWADYVTTALVAQSGVLQAGPTIVRTDGGEQMNFPTLATDIAAAAITEGTAVTQDTSVFGTVPLNAYGTGGYLILTEDLLKDSSVDLGSYIGNLCGRAIGQSIAAYLGDEDTGTGSSAPAAITVGATSGVTAAAVDSVTIDELLTLYGAVIPPYRVNGKWIVNNDIFVEMLTAKSDTGDYITHPSLAANAPDMFLGKPLIEDQYFDASATGNKVAGFGDVGAAYLVRFAGPLQVDFSAEAGFTSFEVYVRYKQRFDAATAVAGAFQIVTLA